ncbi:3-methyl-2-oxobutanoate hydroxymethyltransferase [Paraliobacillus salinarum]|uniref:3-methyl-2-oxobutanoate hydroxymethyltransferase n=1 Tax=Paraliobacillus salinarum TaxID=1158996 RepID=UPI0015F382D2|nr:3-methyl-2-oxobutanoate hydroxymethyltransferase [Paraliobacillus salinarum]
MKNRITLQEMKENNDKITMITAYDYPSAKAAEQAEVDMILVGDSLGMVVLGYDSTVQVTMNDMIHHGKAVTRGASNTFVVVDMPFMSYHISIEESMKNARSLFQSTNAQALKVEGATPEILTLISKLTQAGIPVVGHIGLTPQSVNVLGGFRVQGKDKESVARLIKDAKALEASGAISVVLECIPEEVASHITNQLTIPTIGIGAGPNCDGQVLVYHDILQYGVQRLPKFVKTYEDLNSSIPKAISEYISDVKQVSFPNESQSYFLSEDLKQSLKMGDL